MFANGAPVITPMPAKQGPVLNAMVGNRFIEIKGKDYLQPYKVRESGTTIMVVCKECKSCIFTQNAKLEPNVVDIEVE